MIWSGQQLEEALDVKVNHDLQAGIVQFNSKDISEDEIFIALPGNTDGHLYAEDAIKRGAACVIVSKIIQNIPREKTIIVEDIRRALQQMAVYKRERSKAKFIGITGSVGKTSTKEALKIMLSYFGKTFASRGNFNNDLGVPINLASMADDTEYAIFEIGMNHAGEIRELTKMVKPDIAMITLVSAAHLEFFNSVDGIADAKSEIIEGLSPSGCAVINMDSVSYERIIENIKKFGVKNISSYGESELADSQLELYENLNPGMHLAYNINSLKVDITLPNLLPKHQTKNFAGCLNMVSNLGLDVVVSAKSLSKFSSGEGRGKIVNARRGEKKYNIICDYYNANPESLKASLEYLKQIKHPKKIVIIGDMLELGERSPEFHQQLVPFVIDSGATKILLVGTLIKFINDLLPKNLYIRQFEKVDKLITELVDILDDEELILIKGSKEIKLNKILEYFDRIESVN